MSHVFAPSPSSLAPERLAAADHLAAGLEAAQLTWLSGYFAGLATAANHSTSARALPNAGLAAVPAGGATAQPHLREAAQPTLTILSASHTGNGRKIAERLLAAARGAGVAARVVRAGDVSPRAVAREKLLYVIVSTHGEGDPPEEARALFEFLGSKRAPQLAGLQYAVLALGDSSYANFCAAGRFVDERLAKLGARRLLPRVDCDVDYERLARPWLDDAVARVSEYADKSVVGKARAGDTLLADVSSAADREALRAPHAAPATRAHPAGAEILVNQRITSRDALRDVRHVELAIDASLAYQPGDAIGIVHENPATAIDALLVATKLDGDAVVEHGGSPRKLHECLRDALEITRVARPLLAYLADRGNDPARELLAPQNATTLAELIRRSQAADIVARFPIGWTPRSLIEALRPIAPRLYSIASSQAEVGDEAHVTVAVVGSERGTAPGAASSFLASRSVDSRVRAWIERNERFRLPADTGRDIIMIGPGTGVAPFRGFLQERLASGASGRHWLIFGGRTMRDDFLYQVEWLAALKRGALNRLDAAFSRDQAHKIYVQDNMRTAGRELFAWLADGASLYVCGDAERMAPDVHAALLDIVAEHGAMSADDARDWVADLTAEGRYLRDVY
jgi:sulfite reductase (NADPH) flavoprotein alpha-component